MCTPKWPHHAVFEVSKIIGAESHFAIGGSQWKFAVIMPPVTPNGDHPAIALRSRTSKFCTKAQWHRRKVWNPRHHVAYNSLQYALGSLLTRLLRSHCDLCVPTFIISVLSMRSQCAPAEICALSLRPSRFHCAPTTLSVRFATPFTAFVRRV